MALRNLPKPRLGLSIGAILMLASLCARFAFAAEATQGTAELLANFPKWKLTISTADARVHRFDIWVAADNAHRERGLMFVRQLAENSGMLFLYDKPQIISMWMKNTFIPLDMIFTDADGRVLDIAANTTPQSLKIIESKRPASGVLEVNAGTVKRLNIRIGSILDWQGTTGAR